MQLAEMANNIKLGEAYSLMEELSQAIDLAYQARKSGIGAGEKVSPFARQQNLFAFDEGETVADYTNATVLMLADMLNDSRVSQLKKVLALYNDKAASSAAGQFDIFSGSVKSKEEILKDVLNILNYGTKQEQQQALDTAREQRKAAAVSEQGRGAGVSEDGTDATSGAGSGERNDDGRGGNGSIDERGTGEEVDENGRPFVKKEKPVSASSSDIETEPEGKRNGTATPQNGALSSGKDTNISETETWDEHVNKAMDVYDKTYSETEKKDGERLRKEAAECSDERLLNIYIKDVSIAGEFGKGKDGLRHFVGTYDLYAPPSYERAEDTEKRIRKAKRNHLEAAVDIAKDSFVIDVLRAELDRRGIEHKDKYSMDEFSRAVNWLKAEQPKQQKTGGEAGKTGRRDKALLGAVVERLKKALGKDRVVTEMNEAQKALIASVNGGVQLNKAQKRTLETARLNPQGEGTKGTVVSSVDGAKILNNLDTLAENLKKSSNRGKTFIGDVAKAIGAAQSGSKSQYATFETKNGQTVTIRLGNHNATVSNFDNNGEDNGISIVISRNANKGITNNGTAHLVEFFYPLKAINNADGKPLSEIVRSIKQSLYSGEYKDTTGLAEREEVNAEQIRYHSVKFFKTPQGEVYGFTIGGKVYIDPTIAKADTPIHEYSHLWADMVHAEDPEMWQHIKEVLTHDPDVKPFMDIVRRRYPELTGEGTEDDFLKEVLSHFSGAKGLERLEEAAKEFEEQDGNGHISLAKARAALAKVKAALDKFWGKVAELFGLRFKNAQEVADKILKDLLDGVDPTAVRTEQSKARNKEYMEAVEKGDKETAQRMVNEAAKEAGYIQNDDYKTSHRAPAASVDKKDFTNLDALREIAEETGDVNLFAVAQNVSSQPDDYFSANGPRKYGYNNAEGMESLRNLKVAMNEIKRQVAEYGEVKDMPKVKVYRAVPKDIKAGQLESEGQWVSPSREYAKGHGRHVFGYGNYRIIEQEVRADELWWDGNDIKEWGFDDGTTNAYKNTKNNRKLLDPVTYDDAGNVIPLSKRFDSRNADIRFQKVGGDEEDNRTVAIVGADREHGFANFNEARKWAKENIVGEYENPEIGGVNISGKAIDKYLSEKAVSKSDNKDVHLSALKVMPSIIENSIVGEVQADRVGNTNIKDIVRLYGAIDIDGNTYRVKTTVKRYNDNAVKTKAYSYEVTEIELLEGFSGTPHTQSADFVPTSNNSISAAKLLNNSETAKDNLQEAWRESDAAASGDWYDGESAERIGAFTGKSRKQIDAFKERQKRDAKKHFKETAEKLHLADRVTFLDDDSELTGGFKGKKGWYDIESGKITIVLGNHSSKDIAGANIHNGESHRWALNSAFPRLSA